MKICIVDSGITSVNEKISKIINIKEDRKKIFVKENFLFSKNIHGTGIFNFIEENCNENNEYIIINYFSKENCSERVLIFTLEYILKNIDCDLINISSGLLFLKQHDYAQKLINDIVSKNTLIVSSFPNDSYLGYPAAFNNVIGVATIDIELNKDEFIYCENSPIQIIMSNRIWKSKVESKNIPFIGNSFATAYISSFLINNLNNCENLNAEAKKLLCKKAKSIQQFPKKENNTLDLPNINKVIFFPYQKEIETILFNQELFSFKIIQGFTHRLLGNLNKTISLINTNTHLLDIETLLSGNYSNNFDTFICGHLKLLSKLLKKDFLEQIIKYCIREKKNLFSFDDLSNYSELIESMRANNLKVYWPSITHMDIPYNRVNKLAYIGIPLVCILGTSKQQGKTSLLMSIRNSLQKEDYSVGCLGSEPYSKLVGMEEFSYGYDSCVNIEYQHIPYVINEKLNRLQHNSELILFGTQSGVLSQPEEFERGILQYSVLESILPDCMILCVNFEDKIKYIKKTKIFLESLYPSRIIGIVIFPFKKSNKHFLIASKLKAVSKFNLLIRKIFLFFFFRIPIYENFNIREYKKISKRIISFLKE